MFVLFCFFARRDIKNVIYQTFTFSSQFKTSLNKFFKSCYFIPRGHFLSVQCFQNLMQPAWEDQNFQKIKKIEKYAEGFHKQQKIFKNKRNSKH